MARKKAAKRKRAPKPSPGPQGEVALMLCESLLHVLVEERIITKEKAIEAIESVVELTREMAQDGRATRSRPARDRARTALAMVEFIRNTFAAKSSC